MGLDGIIGNQDAVKALKGMAETGRIPHAMMLYENDGCGAMAFVLAFLGRIMGDERKVSGMIHPDVHYVYPVANGSKVTDKVENLRAERFAEYWRSLMTSNPYALEEEVSAAFGIEGKQAVINNAEAKEVLETVWLTSVEGGWKAVVVYLPEKMNAASANRLLKAVEEPPEKTVFIMITHAPEKVMQTISSRCQAIRILPYSKQEIVQVLTSRFGKDASEASRATLVAGGSVGAALRHLSGKEDYLRRMEMFKGLVDSLVSKDLCAALGWADAMAALPSRENQKAFCKFVGENLRKVFLIQQGLCQIAGVSEDEKDYYVRLASSCAKSFPRKAAACLDRAVTLIDRNVNQKIIFTDLVGRMYLSF